MFGPTITVDNVAHIIQIALTPVFLLSGIASLLGVFSGRLARVADRVDSLTDVLETATPSQRPHLQRRLAYLKKRSHALDAAVMLGAFGGGATCLAALLLFVGTLRDEAGGTFLFACFGLALLCTAGALTAFLAEMLMASRGIRDQLSDAGNVVEAAEGSRQRSGGPRRRSPVDGNEFLNRGQPG